MRHCHPHWLPVWASLLGGALFLTTACHGATPFRPTEKPGIPVTMSIEPVGAVERGAITGFTVIATALTECPDFSLDVDLPDGLALFSGDLHQRGPVRANTQFRLTFALRVPHTGNHVIKATARMQFGPLNAFEASATHLIGSPAKPTPSDAGVSTERNGESIREYPLP